MSLNSDLGAALTHAKAGRHKAAIKAARAGMKRHKTHPAFPNIVAIGLCSTGKPREALGFFQKALKLDPGFHDARRNLAQALVSLEDFDTAARVAARLAAALPDDPSAWHLLGLAQAEGGHLAEADTSLTKGIGIAPRNASLLTLRGSVRKQQGQEALALQDLQGALRAAPNNLGVMLQTADLLARSAQEDAAVLLLERAVAQAPNDPDTRMRQAMQYQAMGRSDDAIAAFQIVLHLRPGDALALENLSLILPLAKAETVQTAAQDAMRDAKGAARASLLFALAHLARRQADADSAADLYAQANAQVAALTPYQAQRETDLNAALMARDWIAPPDLEPITPAPVYIVGLPRSGTTLAEAILGAHPSVAPLGERRVGDLLFPIIHDPAPFDSAAIQRFRAADLALLPDMAPGITAYTDKLPENHRMIGPLLAAYPDCRIIHMQRDPRDLALSLWQGHFGEGALAYAYDWAAMAHRFNLYASIMAHWHRTHPGRILDVRYEDLVGDVTATGQKMAAFCDLSWVDQMAHPDQNASQILTLTAYQLRQPVHQRSVGKWQDHGALLAPFLAALDPELWPGLTASGT